MTRAMNPIKYFIGEAPDTKTGWYAAAGAVIVGLLATWRQRYSGRLRNKASIRKARITQNANQIATQAKQIETLFGQNNLSNQRFDTMSAQLLKAEQTIGEIREQNAKTVGALEAKNAKLEEKVDNLTALSAKQETEIVGLRAGRLQQDKELHSARLEINTLQGQVNTMSLAQGKPAPYPIHKQMPIADSKE